ncbi:hypothetical protein ISN45_Aa03g004190 [Arabidopsis thaliana x Arabidopsis arenosa]|uniref:Transmembrane protein n=1 Tax=Arabidopsis thaliana x Arabidopsis arenosa TaxID=1240361 RepID=A0A8T2AS58_9BRAS|nr:hypothetical protein ISN45_Aa03g004190 [Arabidopsis thaliana x Arabidopsis arenosa]
MMDLLELRTKNLTVKMKLFDAHCHLQDKRVIDEASQLISAAFSCRCYQFRSQWNLRERLGLGERDGRDVSFCCTLHRTTSLISQTLSDTDEIGAETENFLVDAIESSDSPLLGNETAGDEKYFGKRRKIASWSIARVCIGVLGLASAASAERLPMLFIILTTGAITALCVSLLGSLLAQPRTQIPVKSTIAIGVLAAALAFFMDVVQLSEMVKCWHSNGIHCRCSLCASS